MMSQRTGEELIFLLRSLNLEITITVLIDQTTQCHTIVK